MYRLSTHQFLILLFIIFLVFVMTTIGLCYEKNAFKYVKGFFGGKMWECSDDPKDLHSASCIVNDYSQHKEEIQKKVCDNVRQCDNFGKDSGYNYRDNINCC